MRPLLPPEIAIRYRPMAANEARAASYGRLSGALGALLELLAPVLVTAHQWDLNERPMIAHRMALQEVNA